MSLQTKREELAAALTAGGVPASAHVPARAVPPVAVVLPDEPYLALAEGEAGTMCGELLVRFRVVLLGARGTNEVAANGMDALIVSAVLGLEAAHVDVTEVSEPAEVELNNATYLGTVIRAETLATLTTEE